MSVQSTLYRERLDWDELNGRLNSPLTTVEELTALIPVAAARRDVNLLVRARSLAVLTMDPVPLKVRTVARDALAMRITSVALNEINGDQSSVREIVEFLVHIYAGDSQNARTATSEHDLIVQKFGAKLIELKSKGILHANCPIDEIVRLCAYSGAHADLRSFKAISAIPYLCQTLAAFEDHLKQNPLQADWTLMPLHDSRLSQEQVHWKNPKNDSRIKETQKLFLSDTRAIMEAIQFYVNGTKHDSILITILYLLWQSEEYIATIT